MRQKYNDNIKRPKFKENQIGIIKMYAFCQKIEQRTSGPGESAAGDNLVNKQTIAILILTNISGNKGNQEMKFSQLIEYNTRNIFFEKLYTKCAGETIPRPLSKKSKLSISLDQ